MNNVLSFLILILFFYGRSLHTKKPKAHVKWMTLVMVLDLSLVAYLALFRDVLTKIDAGMSSLLIIHLFFALGTVVLYFIMAYSGYKISKGEDSFRRVMRRLDYVMVGARVFTLITSLALTISK